MIWNVFNLIDAFVFFKQITKIKDNWKNCWYFQ